MRSRAAGIAERREAREFLAPAVAHRIRQIGAEVAEELERASRCAIPHP